MSSGAKVAIWAGIGVSALVILVVVIAVLVSSRGERGDPAIVNGRGSYAITLVENGRDVRKVALVANRQVWITVNNDFNRNVQLYVFDPQNRLVASDTPPFGGNCNVNFRPMRSGLYRIEVVNLGPGNNRCVVRCN
jgi:hypothetical protein